jgi:hypothetical protein
MRKNENIHVDETKKMENPLMCRWKAHSFNITPQNQRNTRLEAIRTASLRAAGIVKALLNFNRKTAGEQRPTNPVFAIKKALSFLRALILRSLTGSLIPILQPENFAIIQGWDWLLFIPLSKIIRV